MNATKSALPVITLTAEETQQALDVGRRRHESSEAHGYLQSDGSKASNGLKNHQRGAAAEIAASKYLGIPWDATVDGYRSVPDVANSVEVRGRTKARPYLRLKQSDKVRKTDRLFVSVERLGNGRFRLDGWTRPSVGMIDIHFVPDDPDSHMPEWHVPLTKLFPPETLETALREHLGSRFDDLRNKIIADAASRHNEVP
jgi:hypothetical protein